MAKAWKLKPLKRKKSLKELTVTSIRILCVMLWRLTDRRLAAVERAGRWLFSIESRLAYLSQLDAIFADY
jgi:hypothetical protein